MVSKRDRILEIARFLEENGIEINIGKNKARGNKGFFKAQGNRFRIDVAKGLSDDAILSTIVHEFGHYIHYNYDKTLNDLSFVFKDNDLELQEELLQLTVNSIPSENVRPLFEQQDRALKEINDLVSRLRAVYSDFNPSKPYLPIEDAIKKTPLKHLLKYDEVKLIEMFCVKKYSIKSLSEDDFTSLYLKLKSKQRLLKRLKGRVSKLNRYYNQPTELFARSFEAYFLKNNATSKLAPNVCRAYESFINNSSSKLLTDFVKFFI